MTNLSPDTAVALMQATEAQTNSKLRELNSGVKLQGQSNVDEVAQDFEAMFVAEMMKPMFEGIETGGMFGGGKTEEVFRGLLLQEYGKMIAETGQLGIADAVKTEMIKMQETVNGQSSTDQNQ